MCRQWHFFGHVVRGSSVKEQQVCMRSSDKKIGRERRKIRKIDRVPEMTGEKAIEESLKLAKRQIGMEEKIQRI